MALHMSGPAASWVGAQAGLRLRAQGLPSGSPRALLGLPHSMEAQFPREGGECGWHFDGLALESQSITFPVLFTCTF